MNTVGRFSRRWIAILVAAALLLGACGSSAPDESSTADEGDTPSELPLEVDDSSSEVEEVEDLDDLAEVEITPESFEELKNDEVARAAILEEMQAQGLDAEEAECFLDSVSPGLFITFSTGDQPDDAQFGELITLLDTCEIAFGAES